MERATTNGKSNGDLVLCKFRLGLVGVTPGIASQFNPDQVIPLLRRHCSGDWGNVCEEDKKTNDAAMNNGSRLMSEYTADNLEGVSTRVWIITEADRSSTVVLLPEEY